MTCFICTPLFLNCYYLTCSVGVISHFKHHFALQSLISYDSFGCCVVSGCCEVPGWCRLAGVSPSVRGHCWRVGVACRAPGLGGRADGEVLARDGARSEPAAARGRPRQVRAEPEGAGHRHPAAVGHHGRWAMLLPSIAAARSDEQQGSRGRRHAPTAGTLGTRWKC